MRVVKYGHIKPSYAFCRGCGAILEFTKSDSEMSFMNIRNGPQGEGKDYVVKCPICSRAVYDGEWKDSPEEC